MILLHPTSNKATMVRNFKDKFSKWKLSGKKTNVEEDVSGEDLAVFRKFGHKVRNWKQDNLISCCVYGRDTESLK